MQCPSEGTIYFAAGVWPFMGVFIYGLDAETGKVIWQNERAGFLHTEQSEVTGNAFGGASPQGSLAIADERLVVPTGLAWPVYLNRRTGRMEPYVSGNRFLQSGETNSRAQFVAHRDGPHQSYGRKLLVWDPDTGKTLAEFYGFNLLTGELKKRRSPLTGNESRWSFRRTGGCTQWRYHHSLPRIETHD